MMALTSKRVFVNGKQLASVLCRKYITDNRREATTNFVADYEASHITTSTFQKLALSVGSSVVSLLDPSRGGDLQILFELLVGVISYNNKYCVLKIFRNNEK